MDFLYFLVGSDADTILWWQMVVRGILIFFYALFLVRIGGTRIFGKNTSFDIVLGVILGSILGRALTGNAPLLPTTAAATALVLLHMLLSKLSFYSRNIGYLIKGKERQLMEDGDILWDRMAKSSITHNDLLEALRSNGNVAELEKVRSAFLERSGDISVIKKTQ
ncbi:MAG: DUF421 domain-containing protein [Desulforhabdus sp.]|nr:DUF421 domain-containing protein [Desulforhabdus sp.]